LTSANNAAASAQEAQDIVDSIITADLTEATSSVLTITGGTDAVLGSGTTIQVKQAGSSQSGFLSSTDWTTFNSKQNTITNPVTGTGASGQVAFWNGTSSQTGDNGLFWNNTNKRLGIGTVNPGFFLDVVGQSRFSSNINLGTTDNSNGVRIVFNNSSLGRNFQIANNFNVGNALEITPSTTVNGTSFTTPALVINGASSNVLIGTTTDAGFRLDVNGTARVQGVLTTTADAVVNGVSVGRGGGSIDGNTRVGGNALNANTTGTNNTAIGRDALFSNTTGSFNTANGRSALLNNTTGTNNTANGRGALFSNITGSNNIANGFESGRFIADGTTALTIANNSLFLGSETRALADNQTNQIVIGHTAIGLGSNTTVIGNSSTTFGRWFGNLLVGSSTNSGQQLQVTGTSLLNGLSTIQGTTASDSGQLGSELLTTGTGDASWTGASFATGYTHVAGSTTTLTSTLAGVANTFYQITYTVTGRTTGTFNIDFGGQTLGGLGSSSAQGVRATTTGTLVITPTSSFDGTIVLSIRVITASSASVTFNNSSGTVTNQIRISNSVSNTFFGLNAGSRNTTGINNTFIGSSTGSNNTSGNSNSFFGISAGRDNTFGSSNSFFGSSAGLLNTTGTANSFFGRDSGVLNTTGTNNSFFGVDSGLNNTSGSSNSFFGVQSGRANTTASNNSFFGIQAGRDNTTGNLNSFFGSTAGQSNTTGASNAFFGENAALNNTTGSQNSVFGRNAGRYIADGTTSNTITNNSVFLGFDTRANASNQTNQIVIGHTAIGLGSNTTVLGNTSTTHGRWYGSLLLGTTTNAASSILTMESTTQGFLPPRMTTTQKNAIASPATGLVVYDNTLNKLSVFTGLVWETVTSL
jgi:hypothetical protein